MIAKKILHPQRVRAITGTFAFVEHRFLRDGFWKELSHHELLLYFFLILVSDRQGLSYYSCEAICSACTIPVDEYLVARNALIAKDLIAFDGQLFQVLSLPRKQPVAADGQRQRKESPEEQDPAELSEIMRKWLDLQKVQP